MACQHDSTEFRIDGPFECGSDTALTLLGWLDCCAMIAEILLMVGVHKYYKIGV
jgi:hypothetical protein